VAYDTNGVATMAFESTDSAPVSSVQVGDTLQPGSKPITEYPKALIPLSDEQRVGLLAWINEWFTACDGSHSAKLQEWAMQEQEYRARSQGVLSSPFVGACGDTVPVSAMAIDPIHARLDTGIFKASPVIRIKPLSKKTTKYVDALERWIEFYQKHRLQLRKVASPRILECAKHGTMIFKTVYECEKYNIMTYDKDWKVIKKEVTRFKGPKVFGLSLADVMFPPQYQDIQDCPIVFERQRFAPTQLRVLEASQKITNVDKVQDQRQMQRNVLEIERQRSANHEETASEIKNLVEIYEIWCDYDINGDGLPEKLVITWHKGTDTILQCRYNWYFHQRKPYTVIPYSVSNDSLYGIGIGEMCSFFQSAQTKWHRMATDNTYLANIRMFIAKKESGIEEVPKLYSGKTFFVDDPTKDFIPFAVANIYPSTLTERQNLFGLAEKRTGVSDYLTGRESPIVGSRATATSTVALIQEGTRRVEEVLENIRVGFAEIIENCLYIWIQYGLDGLDDIVFGNDEISNLIKEFFDSVSEQNVHGSLSVDLAATDAANNRSVQQQVQLAIIQVMMQYLDKLVQAGQLAISAATQEPQLTALISEVMTSARKMFKDLLQKYDVPNPEDYLPDLEKYLNAAAQGQGIPGNDQGNAVGPEGQPSIPSPSGQTFETPGAGAGGTGVPAGYPPVPYPGQGGRTPSGMPSF
jgi:hypothetical protein